MKKLFLIPIFVMIVSVASAQGFSMQSITGLVIPVVLFICGSVVAIFVTKFIANARLKEKEAKYEMLKKFAENGVKVPDEYAGDTYQTNQRPVYEGNVDNGQIDPNAQKIERQRLLRELSVFKNGGVVALIFGFITMLSADNFRDFFQLIVGVILLIIGSVGLHIYYKGINKR